MPPLFHQPRHAKPREVPAAKAVLVPLVLAGSTGSAFGGLAMSASAAEKPTAVTAASAATITASQSEAMLLERAQQAEQRASRQRAVEAQQAAEQAAAAEAARLAAEQAAAAEAARLAAEQAAAEKARAEEAARASARPGSGRLTSGYGPRWGRMHRGIDLAAGTGAPIRAAAEGTVISAGAEGGYGRAVRIRHADGSETLYAHNSALLVRAGQRVAAGEQIAREGATGNVTGPHLHFEVRVNGGNVNPLSWLRQRGVGV